MQEELDVALFFRTARGVTLTPAGTVLLAEVRRLLPQVELAKTRTRQAAQGLFGVVNIGFTTAVAELRFALAAVREARLAQPDVDFRLQLIPSDQQVNALLRGDIDIGLLYRRPPYPPGLVYRDLRLDHYVVMVPDSHRLAKQRTVKLADLQGEDMMFPSPTLRPATYREMMAACQRGGLEPKIVLEAEGLITVVAEGIAIALYNSALAENTQMPGVTYLTVEDMGVPLHLAAMWQQERETPALLRFVDLLENNVKT
jgi:DNA-binding transcriptional LysR family regulator